MNKTKTLDEFEEGFDFSTKVLAGAIVKRDDLKAIPLIISIGELAKYYSLDFILESVERNYNGGDFTTQQEYIEQAKTIQTLIAHRKKSQTY